MKESSNLFVGELPKKLSIKETSELYIRAKNGDKTAREEFINGTIPRVVTIVKSVKGITKDEREELINICMIEVIKLIDTCNYDSKTIYSGITIYLDRAIKRYMDMKLKREETFTYGLESDYLSQLLDPKEEYEKKEMYEKIKMAISCLPADGKNILMEYYVNEIGGMRIAENSGLSPQHVFYEIKKYSDTIREYSLKSMKELKEMQEVIKPEIKESKHKTHISDNVDVITDDLFIDNEFVNLSGVQEQQLFRLYKKGNLKARDELILGNVKRITLFVNKIPGLSLEDKKELVSSCLLEVTRAVNGYRGKTLEGLYRIMTKMVMRMIEMQTTKTERYYNMFDVVEEPWEEVNGYVDPVLFTEEDEASRLIREELQQYLLDDIKLNPELAEIISQRLSNGEKIRKILEDIVSKDYTTLKRFIYIKTELAEFAKNLLKEITGNSYDNLKVPKSYNRRKVK